MLVVENAGQFLLLFFTHAVTMVTCRAGKRYAVCLYPLSLSDISERLSPIVLVVIVRLSPTSPTRPELDRLARLWFALLELAWYQEGGSPSTQQQQQPQQQRRGGDNKGRRASSAPDDGGRSVDLSRKAAVAVLRSGPWSPDKNRELVVSQVMVWRLFFRRAVWKNL